MVHYTNASVIIPEEFSDTEDLEGVFSGWNADKKTYDPKTWLYEGVGGRALHRSRDRLAHKKVATRNTARSLRRT